GRPIAHNHFACAFPSVGIRDPERYVFDMLSSTLGGGSTSRLFETIREREGLTYAIYSFNSMYLHAGVLGMYAAVAPENLQRTIDLCVDEMHKLQDAPMPEEELLSNREQLKGGLLLALEGTFNRMARMVRSLMIFDRIVPIDEILAGVDAVTAEAVQQSAQKTFIQDRCATAVLGPSGDTPPNVAL
ncbi:MAG: insulinase family protein, partial [Candidatus Hydrogenedentes bacterium]|nr:insulinase family protein [Candidatus Hydrogenedentota bacterium]